MRGPQGLMAPPQGQVCHLPPRTHKVTRERVPTDPHDGSDDSDQQHGGIDNGDCSVDVKATGERALPIVRPTGTRSHPATRRRTTPRRLPCRPCVSAHTCLSPTLARPGSHVPAAYGSSAECDLFVLFRGGKIDGERSLMAHCPHRPGTHGRPYHGARGRPGAQFGQAARPQRSVTSLS